MKEFPTIVLVHDSRERFPLGMDVLNTLTFHGYAGAPAQTAHPGPLVLPERVLPAAILRDTVAYIETQHREGLDWTRLNLWTTFNSGPPHTELVSAHQGDWELFQLGCDPHDGRPLLATLSQHGGGRACSYMSLERVKDKNAVRLYVALGSHAIYATPGRHGFDVCDGKGRHITPRLEKPGEWFRWPGRWGAKDAPASPGNQRKDAAIWHTNLETG